jgi:hypothetical protein
MVLKPAAILGRRKPVAPEEISDPSEWPEGFWDAPTEPPTWPDAGLCVTCQAPRAQMGDGWCEDHQPESDDDHYEPDPI